jgi:hypothetical protein
VVDIGQRTLGARQWVGAEPHCCFNESTARRRTTICPLFSLTDHAASHSAFETTNHSGGLSTNDKLMAGLDRLTASHSQLTGSSNYDE